MINLNIPPVSIFDNDALTINVLKSLNTEIEIELGEIQKISCNFMNHPLYLDDIKKTICNILYRQSYLISLLDNKLDPKQQMKRKLDIILEE